MRTLQELLKDSRPFSVEDRARSWRLLLSTLAILALTFAGAAAPIAWPLRLVSSVLTGLVLLRLFMFYHDYLHDAIFRDSLAAKAILWVYGIFILNPPNVWKRSHNYHHQNNAQMATAGIGSFPVMTVEQYRKASTARRLLYRASRSGITIFFGYFFIFLIGMCTKSFLTDPKRHFDSLIALMVHFGLAVALYYLGGISLLMYVLILPLFLACAIGGYLFYVQHNFPGVIMKPREEWTYVFAAMKSSSYMQGGPLVEWFTANIGYHHVHHLNARIPFYNLPGAMRAIPELREPLVTSLHPRDVLAALRLKLWDAQRQEMVGFPAIEVDLDQRLPVG